MTPIEVKALIESALPWWMTGAGPWFGAVLLSCITGAGAYFGAYLAEKARNLATKEDVAAITKQVALVKGAVSSDLWARQERWKLKRDVYLRILEDLYEGLAIYNGMMTGLAGHLAPAEAQKTLTEATSRTVKNTDSIRRIFAVSGLLLNEAAQTALHGFEDTMVRTGDKLTLTIGDLQGIAANFARTHDALLTAAKDDLAAV